MTRLIPGCTLVGLMLTLLPAPTSAAGSNTATTLFPVDEVTQLETHTFLDCHPNGSCDFVAGANLRTPDGLSARAVGAPNHRDPFDEPVGLSGRARHQPVRTGNEGGRIRRDHHRLLRRGSAGQIPDHRGHRLDQLVDRSTDDRRQRHRVYTHAGGLPGGQPHLAQHLRASQLFLARTRPGTR